MTLEEYVGHLRNYIKDKEPLNRLLNFELENIDSDLEMYINMALGFLRNMPPVTTLYDIGSFPVPSLLIHQATIECLISNGIVAARNDLTYNNGGVTVKIQDGNRYLQQLQLLFRMTDMEIKSYKDLKIAANIAGGWGGSPSPYSTIHSNENLTDIDIIL